MLHDRSSPLGLASIAGDEDGFGFGPGWTPPQTCEVFDNHGPEDLGVFDQREPTPGKYDSICTFSGGWQQSFAVPTGGVGQFTVTMRILGSEGAATTCFWSPCGCTTATPQLLINGVDQPGFFSGRSQLRGFSLSRHRMPAAAICESADSEA